MLKNCSSTLFVSIFSMFSHHVLFPPNSLELWSTIFVYSGACKAKSLQGMRISEEILLKKSLSSIKANIQDLSLSPSYKMRLNMESLLTLHVENQLVVTHFTRDTFTLYEYAVMFGTSVEEAVKRVSKWAAVYYTHPNSYYKLPNHMQFPYLASKFQSQPHRK